MPFRSEREGICRFTTSLAVPALNSKHVFSILFCRHAFDFFIGEVSVGRIAPPSAHERSLLFLRRPIEQARKKKYAPPRFEVLTSAQAKAWLNEKALPEEANTREILKATAKP
jgi:hypothetical protein